MEEPDDRPLSRGDKGFLFRLIGGATVVIVLAALVLGLLDRSRLGSCAAHGFMEVTQPASSD